MPTLSITWHSLDDARVCPVCKALNGYVWVFEAGADELGDQLTHPVYGVVWSLQDGSHAHGHAQYHCRCMITHRFDLLDIRAKCRVLAERIRWADEVRR